MDATNFLYDEDDWRVLLSFLPSGWEGKAKELGALKRARGFKDSETLLRVLLMHIAGGDSLRVTAEKAKLSNLANVSDVALYKRLSKSSEWLRWLAENLSNSWFHRSVDNVYGMNKTIRLIDGSTVQEPGATGTTWRLHYSVNLRNLSCDEVHLTSPKEGEALWRFKINPGDLIIADRGFCGRPSLEHVVSHQGDFIIRFCTNLPLLDNKNNSFDFLKYIKELKTNQIGDWDVKLELGGKLTPARLCAIKKSKDAAELEISRLMRIAGRKDKVPKEKSLEAAKYILVLTTLGREYSPSQILEYYRYRWQVEIVFKRLKSIIGLGHLKKYDELSAKAWLHGKLLVAFLIEAIVSAGTNFSPWGYKTPLCE